MNIYRKAAYVGLTLGLIIGLCACAPTHGIVHDKKYEPSYQYMSQQCYSYGKDGQCKVSMPVVHTQPASYEFDLYNGKDHGWREVDPESYSHYKIGDQYP